MQMMRLKGAILIAVSVAACGCGKRQSAERAAVDEDPTLDLSEPLPWTNLVYRKPVVIVLPKAADSGPDSYEQEQERIKHMTLIDDRSGDQ
jgi:hypothetical protein